MGLFTGLDTEAYDRSYSDVELLRRIGSYFGAHRRQVLITVVFVTLVSLSAAGQTFNI
jgi:hypothetical protein